MNCFMWFHNYKPCGVTLVEKKPYLFADPSCPGSPCSEILYICKRCGNPKVKTIDGWWDLDSLQKKTKVEKM